jgi:hypothetical protein
MCKYKYPFLVVISAIFLAAVMLLARPRKKYTVVKRRYFQ